MPEGNIHLVTVPRKGADTSLWERFLGVLSVDESALSEPIESANSSLSAAQAEFLRRLNDRLQPSEISGRGTSGSSRAS